MTKKSSGIQDHQLSRIIGSFLGKNFFYTKNALIVGTAFVSRSSNYIGATFAWQITFRKSEKNAAEKKTHTEIHAQF